MIGGWGDLANVRDLKDPKLSRVSLCFRYRDLLHVLKAEEPEVQDMTLAHFGTCQHCQIWAAKHKMSWSSL